ncbi:MAG: class D sortase [Bryobacteraceae bacterium]|nr:class D sortase [Bryobacteraceae bacterium]
MTSLSRTRIWHWLEALLLVTALICLGWFGYNWIASEAGQLQSDQELETARARPQEDPSQAAPVNLPKGASIGRIEIPRLRIASVVRQGVDDATLRRAVGHVPFTAMPGQSGNVGLAAHRDTHFRNLRDVQEGDLIRIVTPARTWEYVVDSTKIVNPNNVEVLDPTPDPALTLVTCYPFNFIGHAPKRFIVRAVQKDSELQTGRS